jgi:xylose isomerase
MSMSTYHVIKAGGLNQGGCNFDAKVRRQSFAVQDLVHAHVGGIDLCARAFLTAAKIIQDGRLDSILAERYAGWNSTDGKAILKDKSLDDLEKWALEKKINPQPRSGRQEEIENLLARLIYSDQM